MDNNKEETTIDLMQILSMFCKKAWVIALAGILAAAIGFFASAVVIAPSYSSSILIYVNNKTVSTGTSVSSSDITASQNLVKTYQEILKSRTTLEEVIDKAYLGYTYNELSGMISASASNNTEFMKVTVTSKDAYEAADIANCIADILPARIAEIVEGSSTKIVDRAVVNTNKVSPSVTKYTFIGFLIGAVLAMAVLCLIVIFDSTVPNEDYLRQNYDFPILGNIPDLTAEDSKRYAYYKKSSK